MKVNENERASNLAQIKLKCKLQGTILKHIKETDAGLTYHEIIAVLLEMASDTNRNALKREYGKEDED